MFPLLAAIAAGVVMLWMSAAPPRRPLQLSPIDVRSDPIYTDPAANEPFELTPNWTWPALSLSGQQALGTQPSPSSCAGSGANSSC